VSKKKVFLNSKKLMKNKFIKSIDTYQTVKAKLIETRGKLEFLSSTVPILMLGVGSALVCASLVFLIFTILDVSKYFLCLSYIPCFVLKI
jgi:hypothetical protein